MTSSRSVAAALLIAPLAACGGATADPVDLDEGDRPLVGDAQHSFTLSRTQ